MDSNTLATASTYLNNLLLARGFLRNTKSIDFAKPTRETRAQTINLVHELLLQRDKHEEKREHIADTLHQLRNESERKDAEIARLRKQLAQNEREHTRGQIDVRNAKDDLKKACTEVRSLQAQLGKSRTLCEQIKTQCANDIRKRDSHIEKLKGHLQGQQRGNKSLVVAPSISITGGRSFNASIRSLGDPEYTLKQESSEFLTQLSQNLSEENDALLGLVNGTLQSLRELLGERQVDGQGVERLTAELDGQMQMLKSLLTNPSFVSVEEVDIRDEEIARLRDGWEKMEARWKDVLLMMDGWRRRLEKTGDTINLEDLTRGMGIGLDFEQIKQSISPSRPSRLPRPSARSVEEEEISRDSGVSGVSEDIKSVEPPAFFDLRPPGTTGKRLRELSSDFQSPRRVAFEEVVSEEDDVDTANSRTTERKASGFRASSTRSAIAAPSKGRKRSSSPSEVQATRQKKQEIEPPQSSSFLEEDIPRLTLEEKLKVAQTEADAARSNVQAVEESELELDMVASLRSPVRKSKIKGRPRRRKSTLNPEELASLLNID